MTSEPSPKAPTNSVNNRFATSLAANRTGLIKEWLARVRNDATIPTDMMTTSAVKNHLPALFDDLTQTFHHLGSETVSEQSVKDAGGHGTNRWQQGYELTELLREVKHLRAILIHHLRTFEEQNEDIGFVGRYIISTTLHGFLDEVAIDATQQFLIERLEWKQSP